MPQQNFNASCKALSRIFALAILSCTTQAQTAPSAELGPVIVTGTRVAEPAFNVPASIDRVEGEAFNQDTLGINLSEGLSAVPGVLARDRQNYAQDEQLSMRGFGASSTFGVRAIRLYVDGIPATQPDGQGQVSHFNLASADRVEVLRGPFSALYGNSSGGVIQIFTANGSNPPSLTASSAVGSYGTWRTNVGTSGAAKLAEEAVDYNIDYTHFHTDGFRDHSAASRDSVNGKLHIDLKNRGQLTLLLNVFSGPEAQDALGLTHDQFEQDPTQATSVAAQFNTRKSAEQNQLGAIYEYALNQASSFRLLGYYGNRQIRQFLSTPKASQNNPLSSGGVVGLGTNYGGLDARWSYRRLVLDRPLTLVAGLSYDDLMQHRRGYNNYIGSELGVQGTLRRDEIDTVYNLDQYLQASWQLSERWSLSAGVRHDAVKFDSDDRYIVGTNGNDSGSTAYYATTPVAGLLFKLQPNVHLYGAYGEGFQTPALNELAYRPDGSSGLNLALKAAKSSNGELGAKLRLSERLSANTAVFRTITRNEIVVDTNANGRTTYENAGRTRRQGLESGLEYKPVPKWTLQLAYTYLDATIREDYYTCTGNTCKKPTTLVAAGNRIPAVPESDLYAALRWGADTGWHAGANARYLSKMPVNDSNGFTAAAYGLIGLDGGYIFDLPHWRIATFVRLDNLLDQDYIGSIIVNDANSRFYEPGPGRSVLAGAQFDWKY